MVLPLGESSTTELLALPVTKTLPLESSASAKGRSKATPLPAVIWAPEKLTAVGGVPSGELGTVSPSIRVTLSLPQLASQTFSSGSTTVPCGQLILPTSQPPSGESV